jgi:hypothetical protein
MRGVLLAGLIMAVVLILVRTIMGTPLIKRVAEGFASGGKQLTNTATECPKGTTMYMYEGVAYCCSGTVDPDATTVQKSCTAANSWQRGASKLTFCTLGPATGASGIKNCLELRAGLMQAEGERLCPPSKPNYVKEGERARCCASAANDTYTDCADLGTGKYCDFTADANELKVPESCQFLREKESATACPAKYKPFTTEGQGSLAGLTLYGCTDMGKNCYSSALLTRLRQLGYKTDGLTPCPHSG